MKMKKYLMTGIAALALCVGFTSCSKDLEQLSQEEINELEAQKIVNNYKKAFKAYIGGEVSPTQTWGFGTPEVTRTRAKSDYAGAKGTMQPVEWYQENGQWKSRAYVFPSAPENFPTAPTVQNADNYFSGNYKEIHGEEIWMDENTSSVNVQGYGDLYIVKSGTAENVTISPSWYVGNVPYGSGKKIRVIICSGVTLKIPTNDAGNLQGNVEYYVAPGGSLTCDTFIKLNGTNLFVAQGGSVSGASFETTESGGASSLFYNMGTATFTGDVNIQKYISTVVNDGTLTAANLRTQGSGKFENNGDVIISGKTIVNSNGNTWVNNGFYRTGDFEFTATSSSVINNCKLFVDENFFMNCSDGSSIFQMDGGATSGASVVTKYFYGGGVYGGFNGGPYRIEMGSKSLFKVTDTAYLNSTASGTHTNGYGFFGVGSDFAVFQANKVERGSNPGEGLVAYGGKLYVSAGSHFAQGKSGNYDYIYFFDGDDNQVVIYAPGFQSGTPSISIAPTNCNPGFNYNKPDGWFVRVMAEDLSADEASDFDFNDVVIDVYYTQGETNATIVLQAAGGTLSLRIAENDEWEVHKLFGVPVSTMVNTNWSGSNSANCEPVTLTLNNFGPYDNKNAFLQGVNTGIKLEVKKTLSTGATQWFEMTANQGEPAAKFAVDGKYQWLDERTNIKNEVGTFVDWVTGKIGTLEWY